MQSFFNSFQNYKVLTFTQNDKKNFDQNSVNLSMTQMLIDKQLRSFNFYILMRGTYCSQGLICFMFYFKCANKLIITNLYKNIRFIQLLFSYGFRDSLNLFIKSHNLRFKFLSHIEINAKNGISRVGQVPWFPWFQIFAGGYTPTLTSTHMPNDIKNFRVIKIFHT